MPNYNHAPYLRERIDSILAQTIQDMEVILLDDCSQDNSMEILRAYEHHPKVSHLVRNEVNSGSTFLQWQRGFSMAQGEYIWIAESDDVAEPTFLEESLQRLERDKTIQMTFSRSMYVNAKGEKMSGSPDGRNMYSGNGMYDGHCFAVQRMLYRDVIYNASMVVFRKSVLEKVPTDFVTYRSSGDWVFWFDVMIQGRVAEIPLVLNRFRQHEGKVTVKAVREGRNIEENARCVRHMCSKLHLTALQMTCLRGRMTLRFRKKQFPDKQRVKCSYPELYDGTLWDILVYELDKWFHFSGMLR